MAFWPRIPVHRACAGACCGRGQGRRARAHRGLPRRNPRGQSRGGGQVRLPQDKTAHPACGQPGGAPKPRGAKLAAGRFYPGSPLLIARGMREADSTVLNELHPEEAAKLVRLFAVPPPAPPRPAACARPCRTTAAAAPRRASRRGAGGRRRRGPRPHGAGRGGSGRARRGRERCGCCRGPTASMRGCRSCPPRSAAGSCSSIRPTRPRTRRVRARPAAARPASCVRRRAEAGASAR